MPKKQGEKRMKEFFDSIVKFFCKPVTNTEVKSSDPDMSVAITRRPARRQRVD